MPRQWKEIRAYDSDDLAQWIEMAPSVGMWLARLMRKTPEVGICDIKTRWEDLRGSLRLPLPPRALLVGRSASIERIRRWAFESPASLAVTGHSPQEAVDVFTAWVASLDEPEQSVIASRAIIVDGRDQWNQLAESTERLILVAGYDLGIDEQMVARAAQKGHHVFYAVPIVSSSNQGRLKLERLDRLELEGVLRESGLSEQEAVTLSRHSAGSFTILKRRFCANYATSSPAWSRDGEAENLAPLLLVGAWNKGNEHDQSIVAELAGIDYAKADAIMTKWRGKPDSPVRWTNDIWEFMSPLDAWAFLRASVTSYHLERLETCAERVLAVDDPRLELPRDERWMANIRGKQLPHSSQLRHGVARTLALLGATSDGDTIADTVPLQSRVDQIVRKLLPREATWKRWASLGPLLPLLAEAAPTVFLDAVDLGLTGTIELPKLLNEETGPMFGSAEHTGLLWALERLAIAPDYLLRASLALAKLSERDPGGRVANRPSASLRDIFFSSLPHTAATLDDRLAVLRLIEAQFPETAWKLLPSLIPDPRALIMLHGLPEWRFWAEGWQRGVSSREYALTLSAIVELLSKQLGRWPERFVDLLPHLHFLSGRDRSTLIRGMAKVSLRLDSATRRRCWIELNSFILRQRRFADTDWAVKGDSLDMLNSIEGSLRTDDPVELALPDFKKGSDTVCDHKLPWQEQFELREMHRTDALKAVVSLRGFGGILDLASKVDLPMALGEATFKAFGSKFDAEIIPALLTHANPLIGEFAKAYAALRLNADGGREWGEMQNVKVWGVAQAAALISQMPFDERTWNFAATAGVDVEEAFWEIVAPYGKYLAAPALEAAALKLVAIGRLRSAIDLIAMNADRPDFSAVAQLGVLEAALAATSVLDNEKNNAPFDITTVFERLYEDERIQ